MGSQRVGHYWAAELNWTTAMLWVRYNHPFYKEGKLQLKSLNDLCRETPLECDKNFEECVFYPTCQLWPLASFMDVDRTHRTPGSEMNDFITHSLVVARGSVMMLVAWALLPMRRSPDSQVEPAHAVDLLQDEFWSQGTPKQTCSFGVVETISVSSKDFRYINILEKRVQNKGSQGICLQDH